MTTTYTTPVTTASGDAAIPTTEGTALVVNFGAAETTATTSTSTANPAFTAFYRGQLQTTTSAATGAIGTQTITLKYDES